MIRVNCNIPKFMRVIFFGKGELSFSFLKPSTIPIRWRFQSSAANHLATYFGDDQLDPSMLNTFAHSFNLYRPSRGHKRCKGFSIILRHCGILSGIYGDLQLL